jgi:hypothetical protein
MAQSALAKLVRETSFKAEVDRIIELVGPAEPDRWQVAHAPSPGPPLGPLGSEFPDQVLDWSERLTPDEFPDQWEHFLQRRKVVRRESRAFAERVRFAYISPIAVAWVMWEVLTQYPPLQLGDVPQALAERYAGPLPMFIVNPLTDRDLSLSVHPGHILVDLTHASFDDLTALAGPLRDLQARLGYRKQSGRRPEVNEEQMTFVHTLRTTPTGRGKVRTWHQILKLVNDRFGEDISEPTLKQRYATWKKTQGIDRK